LSSLSWHIRVVVAAEGVEMGPCRLPVQPPLSDIPKLLQGMTVQPFLPRVTDNIYMRLWRLVPAHRCWAFKGLVMTRLKSLLDWLEYQEARNPCRSCLT
jgi:hypothetical protein